MALRKLDAQAHGEALTQVLGAWEQRDASKLPSVQELGRAVTPAVRGQWTQALAGGPSAKSEAAAEALLRLEMAAEVPTPAEQLDARRALQLKLLTRRGDPAPAQTWGQDAGACRARSRRCCASRGAKRMSRGQGSRLESAWLPGTAMSAMSAASAGSACQPAADRVKNSSNSETRPANSPANCARFTK
jgi:hypothetical protein